MSYLSELLRLEQIQLELRGGDQSAVLRELVALVPEIRKDQVQREMFLAALLERERLHTTAIGDGIALPHARNPLAGILNRPLLIFGRHPAGIPFGAPDEAPVRLFFLLASPNLTDHLAMLARLSRVLRSKELRSSLLNVKAQGEIPHAIAQAEDRLTK